MIFSTLLWGMIAVAPRLLCAQYLLSNEQTKCELDAFIYYQDNSQKFSLEDVQKLPASAWKGFNGSTDNANFGNQSGNIWLKFTVIKTVPKQIYLKIRSSSDYRLISLYGFKANQLFHQSQTGNDIAYSKVSYHHTERILELGQADTATYYLMLQTDYTMQISGAFYTDNALIEDNHLYDLGQGLYFGIVLVMFLYNICIFFATGERLYLWYSLTVITSASTLSILTGQFFEFVFPAQSAITSQYIIGLIAIFSLPIPVFAYKFLNIKVLMPRFYYSLYIILSIYVLMAVLNLFHVPISINKGILESMAALVILIIFGAGIRARQKGYRPATFFLLAWSAYFVGTMVFVLQDANLVPTNIWTYYGAQIGSGSEMILLAFGVANKINVYKQEKAAAQLVAYEAMRSQQDSIKAQNDLLERRVEERTIEINASNETLAQNIQELESQRLLLDEKNKMLTAGISSAKIIQDAMQPSAQYTQGFFYNHFELFMPKDIVSGDFYWLRRKGDEIYTAVADCTGHGVHGAFISLLGSKLLDDALAQHDEVTEILEALHRSIVVQFRQSETNNNDGMDIALCRMNPKKQTISFAGAHSSLYLVEAEQIREIRGSARHIGGVRRTEKIPKPFEKQTISISSNTKIYMCSDGYCHQNRLSDNQKMNKVFFKNLLLKNSHLPFHEQKQALRKEFHKWAEDAPQKDDILVVGFMLRDDQV
ncbi:MAG: hypothetical protein EAZ57_09705 [Cytophagales bacterium]|nr:MAG: hypothetical protein EAZ57_09705 [Cytophagales bacterium]